MLKLIQRCGLKSESFLLFNLTGSWERIFEIDGFLSSQRWLIQQYVPRRWWSICIRWEPIQFSIIVAILSIFLPLQTVKQYVRKWSCFKKVILHLLAICLNIIFFIITQTGFIERNSFQLICYVIILLLQPIWFIIVFSSGLIHANHGESIKEYLLNQLKNATTDVFLFSFFSQPSSIILMIIGRYC